MTIATENEWTSSICRALEERVMELEVGSLERRLKSRVLYHAACTGPTGPDGTIETALTEIEIVVCEAGVEVAEAAVGMVIRDLGNYEPMEPGINEVIRSAADLLRGAFFRPTGEFRTDF